VNDAMMQADFAQLKARPLIARLGESLQVAISHYLD